MENAANTLPRAPNLRNGIDSNPVAGARMAGFSVASAQSARAFQRPAPGCDRHYVRTSSNSAIHSSSHGALLGSRTEAPRRNQASPFISVRLAGGDIDRLLAQAGVSRGAMTIRSLPSPKGSPGVARRGPTGLGGVHPPRLSG